MTVTIRYQIGDTFVGWQNCHGPIETIDVPRTITCAQFLDRVSARHRVTLTEVRLDGTPIPAADEINDWNDVGVVLTVSGPGGTIPPILN
jgi:hypothetical protein